jgi:hypothetical protein
MSRSAPLALPWPSEVFSIVVGTSTVIMLKPQGMPSSKIQTVLGSVLEFDSLSRRDMLSLQRYPSLHS